MTMTKSEAEHLRQVALNAIDLAHCLRTGAANQITFQAWWDEFARGKEFEAARKQWLRWKTDFKEFGISCEFVDEGREKHVIVTRHTIEAAERLLADAETVLDAGKEPPRRYPDFVTIKGKVYRLKVYGRDVRPLNDREYAQLKASIEAKGRIEVPVIVDQAGNVVDGKHRLIIAEELGLEDVPMVVLAGHDPEALHNLAVELNACRRQLTKQELAELRRLRQERALSMRAAGMSTRQIADEEGVAPATIQRDLEEVGEGVSSEVMGKDGRRRASQRSQAEQDERRRQIAEMRAEDPDVTVREIAEKLGVSVGTVARELAALGQDDERERPHPTMCEEVREVRPEPAPAVTVQQRAGPCMGVDPEEDDLRTCLEALLTGLDRILELTRGTEAGQIAKDAHTVVDTLIWRVIEGESA